MGRRDFVLKQMGICRWVLRRPDVLQGEINRTVAKNIRLIVVCADAVDNTPLFADVLQAADISPSDYLCVHFDFVPYLHLTHSVTYWLISENVADIDRTLHYCVNAKSVWQSPSWKKFSQTPALKRQLWQQIQQRRHYADC